MSEPSSDIQLPAQEAGKEEVTTLYQRPVPRPLLAQALWLSGAALWAYVVAGELVVNLSLPELLGLVGVLASIGCAWYFAIEGRFLREVAWTRRLAAAFIAFGVFTLCLTFAWTVSGPSISDAAAVTIALWFVGAFLTLFGRHRVRRNEISERPRAPTILAWIGVALLTALSLISALSTT
jgi:hypothetical protein